MHGMCARVLAHIGQRFLGDAVERRGAIGSDLELIAIASEINRQAGALAEAACEPLERRHEAGVQHCRPQCVLDAMRGDDGRLEQLLDRAEPFGVPKLAAEIAPEPWIIRPKITQ